MSNFKYLWIFVLFLNFAIHSFARASSDGTESHGGGTKRGHSAKFLLASCLTSLADQNVLDSSLVAAVGQDRVYSAQERAEQILAGGPAHLSSQCLAFLLYSRSAR